MKKVIQNYFKIFKKITSSIITCTVLKFFIKFGSIQLIIKFIFSVFDAVLNIPNTTYKYISYYRFILIKIHEIKYI